MYWLFVLFSFPLLGSIVYFLVIYLPNSRLEYGARKAVAAAAKSLNPLGELREARAAFEYTPNAQNQMRFALALLESGDAEAAATNYEACLKGPLSSDREIKFCAARAFVESGRFARAITHLEEVRADDTDYKAEQVSLLIARALTGAGRNQEAKSEFEAALKKFGTFEVYAEYAVWALLSGDAAVVKKLQGEINQMMQRWSRHTRNLNMPLVRRLAAANEIANKK
jgi:hypothetical protein